MGRAMPPNRPELDAFLALGNARERLRERKSDLAAANARACANLTPANMDAVVEASAREAHAYEQLRQAWLAWGVAAGIVELPGEEVAA